jgi:hypothetical protein
MNRLAMALPVPGKERYDVSMQTRVISQEEVAANLRAANFGALLEACGFRLWTDEALGNVVEVVLILDHDEWDEAASKSCEQARQIADAAVQELGCFALPVCRTRTEHQGFAERERGMWIPVQLNGAC